jgi:Methyltransferase domain
MNAAEESLRGKSGHDLRHDEPDRLRQRIEALDRLEIYLAPGESSRLIEPEIYERANAIYGKLEAVNAELYGTIRRDIQRGAGREILFQYLPETGRNRGAGGRTSGEGYDYLDELIGGVLQLERPGAGVAKLDAEMVRFQPTPARPIFELIGCTALTERDVLVDIGSGLGHVSLLTAICTDARVIGIELEAAYVDCARRSAEALNLNNVTFIQQDAREADLSRGTVFYLYTPFTGSILRAVLDSLLKEAASREIRVCTFGPCTPIIAEQRWLQAHGAVETGRIAVFSSRK